MGDIYHFALQSEASVRGICWEINTVDQLFNRNLPLANLCHAHLCNEKMVGRKKMV